MKLKKLLLYIATILSIVLAVFFGNVAYTSYQETNLSPTYSTFYCCGSSCLNKKCTTVSWSDLILFILFTAISFSLIVLGAYILFTKIRLSKLKKLLLYSVTTLSIVFAAIFGFASVTNLQHLPTNLLTESCVGRNLALNSIGNIGCTPPPTISWLDLNLFISFTAISFSLLALSVYILLRRKSIRLNS